MRLPRNSVLNIMWSPFCVPYSAEYTRWAQKQKTNPYSGPITIYLCWKPLKFGWDPFSRYWDAAAQSQKSGAHSFEQARFFITIRYSHFALPGQGKMQSKMVKRSRWKGYLCLPSCQYFPPIILTICSMKLQKVMQCMKTTWKNSQT